MTDELTQYQHERRESSERRTKPRETSERRQMVHGVKFTFSGSLGAIEDWLDDNCEGDCEVVVVGMNEDLTRKTIQVMFSNIEDRERFKVSASEF